MNSDTSVKSSNVGEVESKSVINAYSEFSIGSLLLRMGKITAEEADKIMRLHKEKGLKFGEAAQSLGLISEADIQQVLSRQFNYPFLQADQDTFSTALTAAYQPFSAQSEKLRAIRSQLMLHWFSTNKKLLAFTSASSDEGVSPFLANLALVFSQLGKNTLLIDANLRNPSQHKLYNTENRRGLSDVLAGRAGLETIFKIVSFENLSLLTAGTIPPNPQELVSRSAFPVLLTELEQRYDVILIDTPPLNECLDAQAISYAAGGVVFLSKRNKTKIAELTYATSQCVDHGIRIVGSVLLD